MNALIAAYLDRFTPDDPAVHKLANWLEAHRARWEWREGDPWPARAQRFALFQPIEAPVRLADHVMSAPAEPDMALADAGLEKERLKGGLAEAAFQAACLFTSRLKGAPGEPAQGRLLTWSRGADGRQRFPRSWPYLLDACLLPWERVEPSTAHKQRLTTELIDLAPGDPRIKPAPWRSVQDRSAMTVLMRWLTRASVMQFLDIVDDSLSSADARRMWAYRRAFWTSYLMGDPAKGELVIDGAWVAFQSTGAALANRASRRRSEALSFGRHGLKTAEHSALIVQIGDYIVVDWSHSGKYNVWRRSDRSAPKLYLANYAKADANLDEAPLRESHGGAANFTWQKRLASIIEGRSFYSEKPAWRPRVRP